MESNFKIKNLIFDLGGVVILNKKIDFWKFDRKFSLSHGTVDKVVNSLFKKSMLDKNFDVKLWLENNKFPLTFAQYNEVVNELYSGERVNKSLINWIKRKRSVYKISLLTNNTLFLQELLIKKYQILDIFDHIFNSAEVGLAKPDPRFFKYLLIKLKARPNECLFIDNSFKNIEVARKIGFSTVLFINNKDFLEKAFLLGI